MKILLAVALMVLGGCVTYEELEAEQQACEAEKSYSHPDCQVITDKLIRIEIIRSKKRAYEEMKASCDATPKMALWCDSRGSEMVGDCQCVSQEAFDKALNDLYRQF